MRLTVLIVSCLALAGCGGAGVGFVRGEVEERLEDAGRTADALLGGAMDLICSKRFSLRAYETRFPTEKDVEALKTLCSWGTVPPDLLEPDG